LREEFRIKEYDQALKLIEDLRRQVEAGEILSVLFVAERVDDTMYGACTATQNVFAVAGYMLGWAMKRIGFEWKEKSND
jgi:hypothetical protein